MKSMSCVLLLFSIVAWGKSDFEGKEVYFTAEVPSKYSLDLKVRDGQIVCQVTNSINKESRWSIKDFQNGRLSLADGDRQVDLNCTKFLELEKGQGTKDFVSERQLLQALENKNILIKVEKGLVPRRSAR